MAYELLYRSGEGNFAGVIENAEQASSQVLLNAFVEMGIEGIVGDVPALVNVTRSFIEANQMPLNLADKVIWEILETEKVDEDFEKLLSQLTKKGYKFALDDFMFDEQWALLIKNAHIIKYDVMALGKEGIDQQLKILQKFKESAEDIDAKLLAEKVETHEEFEYCKRCGFDYFQGYFIAKPKIIKNKVPSSSRLAILSLLGELNNSDVEIEQLELLISRDARLTYKILKVVDAAAISKTKKVNSIQQAIVILGLDELRCWASLMALSMNDGKPQELLTTAMVRARMCQNLASELGFLDTTPGFTAGLFSLMDALMDMPLEEILGSMPFSEELNAALLHHQGDIGHLVKTVISYESGQWQERECVSGVSADTLYSAFKESIEWATAANHSMLG